ncbi:MAG: hypothetical protein LBL98_00100 [Ruminococcus sp.]|nr:hypothetical protein [Ruminococcus sp.]
MKKLAAAILAILTAATLTACGGAAKDASVEQTTTARSRETTTTAATTTAATTTTTKAAETTAEPSAADLASGHGITLDTDYYIMGNSNFGTAVLTSDGEVIYNITGQEEARSTWTADGSGVYIANYAGEYYQLSLFEDGNIFEVDELTAVLSGHEPYTGYTGTYVYDGFHEWLDVIELDGSAYAGYKHLDENYDVTEQGGATAIAYSNKLIVSQNVYDEMIDPVILTTEDGGDTFSDGAYDYYLVGSTAYDDYYYGGYQSDDDTDTEYFDWAAYAESLGDRTDYRDAAEELGVGIDVVYYNYDLENTYMFISEDGLMYVYTPEVNETVPLRFEMDGDSFFVYDAEDNYVSEMVFDGYEFYEVETGYYYTP